ncbi:hypothetical protein ISF87_31860, partial [Burkholderia pseudomallei]|nr:hypothetical protein [Burkholderia pseudomallei]
MGKKFVIDEKGERNLSNYHTFTEELLEEAVIELLQGMDYEYVYGPDISHDGERPERRDYREVILEQRLRDALFKL